MGKNTRVFLMSISIVSALCNVEVMAQKSYRWVDETGKVTYQDAPPPDSAVSVEEQQTDYSADSGNEDTGAARASQFPVVLYSIPGCEPCDAARNYLKNREIPFTEKNVHNNIELQKEMKEAVGELTVPTLTVGKKIMNG